MKYCFSFMICYFFMIGIANVNPVSATSITVLEGQAKPFLGDEANPNENIFFEAKNDLYWFNNPYHFSEENLTEKYDAIDAFSFTTKDGYLFDDWRLAKESEISDLFNFFPDYTFLDHFLCNEECGNRAIAGLISENRHALVTNDLDINKPISSISYGPADLDWQFGAFIVTSETPTHTPEPSTILLFGTGLVGLAGVCRRKRK